MARSLFLGNLLEPAGKRDTTWLNPYLSPGEKIPPWLLVNERPTKENVEEYCAQSRIALGSIVLSAKQEYQNLFRVSRIKHMKEKVKNCMNELWLKWQVAERLRDKILDEKAVWTKIAECSSPKLISMGPGQPQVFYVHTLKGPIMDYSPSSDLQYEFTGHVRILFEPGAEKRYPIEIEVKASLLGENPSNDWMRMQILNLCPTCLIPVN